MKQEDVGISGVEQMGDSQWEGSRSVRLLIGIIGEGLDRSSEFPLL